MTDLLIAILFFVLAPMLLVWSLRRSVRGKHAVVLLVLGGIAAAVALMAVGWAKDAPSGWAKMGPGLILIGAGALAAPLLASGLMALLIVLVRAL